jgi:DNA-binding CsgD family transcriptional regulator
MTLVAHHIMNVALLPSINDCIKEVTELAYQLNLSSTRKVLITKREAEVALYFCQGLSMKEIGLRLNLSHRTIESNLYRIKLKLGCYTGVQLRNLFLMTQSGRSLVIARYNDLLKNNY